MTETKVRIDGDESSPTLVLAHGAGAGSDSIFLETLTQKLIQEQICVVRFDFEYMLWIQQQQRKRPPPRLDILIREYTHIVKWLDRPCFVGGKSMGGRVASHVLLDTELTRIQAGIVFGFPFHPPGKPSRLRTAHFKQLSRKLLIVQGERDAFGGRELLETLKIEQMISVLWSEDGDHDLKPRKSSGTTQADNLNLAAKRAAAFMHSQGM